jgi:carboxyl-terminal processing protease
VSTHPRPGRARLLVVVLLGCLWFASAFVGGYLLGQAEALAGNLRLVDLTARVASSVGLHPPLQSGGPDGLLSADDQGRFKVFWETWRLLQREYVDRAALDPNRMTHGAVGGLVNSLGDPYTVFSTPREKELTDASLRGSFDGIGVQVDLRDGKLQVVAPIEGTPAAAAGLQPGDLIARVDGREIQGLALNDVVLLIRGPRGTQVALSVLRAGQAAPLELNIERAEIKLQSVRSRMLDDGIGYLRLTSFNANSSQELAAQLKALLEQNPRGLVLDLRSNPGGFLTAAVEITSQFLADGVILYQQDADGQRQEYRAKGGGPATNLPLVVLINKGSASASEIVAAALRDNGRATLVGEKSYGKGSVQTVHTLSDRSGLRVTSGLWLTPRGEPLEKVGLLPDLPVAQAAEALPDQDAQLEEALRFLRSQAAASTAPRV